MLVINGPTVKTWYTIRPKEILYWLFFNASGFELCDEYVKCLSPLNKNNPNENDNEKQKWLSIIILKVIYYNLEFLIAKQTSDNAHDEWMWYGRRNVQGLFVKSLRKTHS